MLTTKQQKWVDHLEDDDHIVIKPYDSSCNEKFEKIKKKIKIVLKNIRVEHHGSTSLGISGQDEIDVYIPVLPDYFNTYIGKLTEIFGVPRSHYPLERARFVTNIDEKHIDIFLINEIENGYKDMVKFESYLRTHTKALDEYKTLKENGYGVSTREYYKRKIEFINNILKKST